MLRQEILIDACVLDCYDQPTNAVQFMVSCENTTSYHIDGIHDTLISCSNSTFKGISICGNKNLVLNLILTQSPPLLALIHFLTRMDFLSS